MEKYDYLIFIICQLFFFQNSLLSLYNVYPIYTFTGMAVTSLCILGPRTRTILRERNTIRYGNYNLIYTRDNPKLIVSICMGKSTRMKRVKSDESDLTWLMSRLIRVVSGYIVYLVLS